MDLFPGSDSDTDISANHDYDGDLESAEAIGNPLSLLCIFASALNFNNYGTCKVNNYVLYSSIQSHIIIL